MRFTKAPAVAAVALSAVIALTVSPADARWRHHHHGGGGAAIAGFAAGALLGGMLAAPRPYYYGPRYYRDDAVQYCLSRFRSYDPYSGTYLGYDGYRHPCP
jgi:hypothetical protein